MRSTCGAQALGAHDVHVDEEFGDLIGDGEGAEDEPRDESEREADLNWATVRSCVCSRRKMWKQLAQARRFPRRDELVRVASDSKFGTSPSVWTDRVANRHLDGGLVKVLLQ